MANGIYNIGALSILTGVNIFLFLQLQAVTLKVADEQKQINALRDDLANQQSTTEDITQKVEKEHDLTIVHMAGTFTLLTCLIAMFHIWAHLRSFAEPIVQRKILAILWMSPIYGVTSFLGLIFPSANEYAMILKDFYEAYCIYQFLSFLVAVLGRGDRDAVVGILAQKADRLAMPYKCLRCLFHPPPEESDRAKAQAVLLECQVLAMQFVFIRPVTSILDFVFAMMDEWEAENNDEGDDDGYFSSSTSYFVSARFFILMVENISVFFAFTGLVKFYRISKEDLSWCQPFQKFMVIKGVVFMTFWQGLIFSIMFNVKIEKGGYEHDHDEHAFDPATHLQNVAICLQMLFFSLAHTCAFPVDEWQEGYRPQPIEKPGMGFKDFVDDVKTVIDSGKANRDLRREHSKKEENAEELPLQPLSEEGSSSSYIV